MRAVYNVADKMWLLNIISFVVRKQAVNFPEGRWMSMWRGKIKISLLAGYVGSSSGTRNIRNAYSKCLFYELNLCHLENFFK